MTTDASYEISVVVPNWNHGSVIADCIEALAGQSLPPDEIIVIDDASTDDSLVRIRVLASRYPTLRVVALPTNGGAIRAMNSGLELARGRFVLFAAADDRVLPGLFETLLPLMRRDHRIAFASAEAIVKDLDRGSTQFRPPALPSFEVAVLCPDDVRNLLTRIDNWVLSGATLFRRDALLSIGGFDASLGPFADGFVVRRLALRDGCAFVPTPLWEWRIRSTGLSRRLAMDPEATAALLLQAQSVMCPDAGFPEWYARVFARRFRFATCRVACSRDVIDRAFIRATGPARPLDRVFYFCAAAMPRTIERMALLVWLFLRLRPMRISDIFWTMVWRTRRRLRGAGALGR